MTNSRYGQNDQNVVIIGGGPAGLTAAYQLAKNGLKSVVVEKDGVLGGLSRTVIYKDYYFDIGGHRFFSKVREVETLWKDVLADDLLRRKRLSRIYYNKKFFYYPLRSFNALFGLGVGKTILVIASYIRARLKPIKPEETFEQWVINRFGRRLFETFFKAYTEKVWGIPCHDIRAEWAAQRIKGLSLLIALKNAFLKSENNAANRKNVVRTLIDEFYYPKFGPGMMWNAVADFAKDRGADILGNSEVEGILWSGDRVEAIEVKDNGSLKIIPGTDFICSMPLRETIQRFKPTLPRELLQAAGNLRYRDFLTVVLIIKKSDIFPDQWIYVHDPDVRAGRIQNFKNWSPSMVPDPEATCLGLEYFCFEGDALWNTPDADLMELAKKELVQLGFVTSEDIADGIVVRMPKAYPVYDSASLGALKTIQLFLGRFKNFHVVGRNGQHKYNNQDHSMITAMKAVDNVLGAHHNLWTVNEEQEYQEEISPDMSRDTAWAQILTGPLAKMDKLAFAAATGTVAGMIIFLATIFLLIKGGAVVGPTLALLGQYFVGYTVTVKGAFIGLAYGFILGFIFGWLFAFLRNMMVSYVIFRAKKTAEREKLKDFLDR